MARFVTFPAINGTYASTDDVNLMDGDTGNLQQSTGEWTGFSGGAPPVQSTALTPIFGTQHGAVTVVPAADFINLFSANEFTTDGVAVAANTEYNFSVYLASSNVAAFPTAQMNVRWYTAGQGFISAATLVSTAPLTTEFVQFQGSATSPGTAEFAIIQFELQGVTPVDGVDFVYFDAAQVQLGTSPVFIPSIRVVGDLDLRIEANFSALNFVYVMDRYGPPGERVFRWVAFDDGRSRLNLTLFDGSDVSTTDAAGVWILDERHQYRVTRLASTGVSQTFVDDVQAGGDNTSTLGALFPAAVRPLAVASRPDAGGAQPTGDVYAASLHDGIGGPAVAVFDPDDIII